MEEVFFSSLLSLGTKLLPYATKAVGKGAPHLATGALSALGSLGIDKIFGKGFLIPDSKVELLIKNKNLLTQKQKEHILNSLQPGGQDQQKDSEMVLWVHYLQVLNFL